MIDERILMKGESAKKRSKNRRKRCSAEILFEGIPVPGCGEVFTDRHVICLFWDGREGAGGVAAALSEKRASRRTGQAAASCRGCRPVRPVAGDYGNGPPPRKRADADWGPDQEPMTSP